MPDFLVFYNCGREPSFPMIRTVTETDTINAVIAARVEERKLVGVNCPDCVLATVTVAP